MISDVCFSLKHQTEKVITEVNIVMLLDLPLWIIVVILIPVIIACFLVLWFWCCDLFHYCCCLQNNSIIANNRARSIEENTIKDDMLPAYETLPPPPYTTWIKTL